MEQQSAEIRGILSSPAIEHTPYFEDSLFLYGKD